MFVTSHHWSNHTWRRYLCRKMQLLGFSYKRKVCQKIEHYSCSCFCLLKRWWDNKIKRISIHLFFSPYSKLFKLNQRFCADFHFDLCSRVKDQCSGLEVYIWPQILFFFMCLSKGSNSTAGYIFVFTVFKNHLFVQFENSNLFYKDIAALHVRPASVFFIVFFPSLPGCKITTGRNSNFKLEVVFWSHFDITMVL